MNCCGNSKYIKYIWIFTGLVILAALIFSLASCGRREKTEQANVAGGPQEQILYYTCGMHPSVRVSPQEYDKGKVNCPICNMKLTPVFKEAEETEAGEVYYGCGVDTEGKCPHCDLGQPDGRCICGEHSFMIEGQKMDCPVCGRPLKKLTKEEVDRLKGVVSKVRIKGEQARLAGVATEPVMRRHLFKKIRTVGKVAYDPNLAVAQEEFISSLEVLDKIKESEIPEIKERTMSLVESSRRKLRLLGLSEAQVNELEAKREVQKSLVLPEEKMWVYADVYEYELPWVKEGQEIEATTVSLPGEKFGGVISSVNPVLDPKTRSVKLRAEVENPQLRLKPEMYVDVVIMSMYVSPSGEHLVLAIPKDAVLDTGLRKIAWVDKGSGEYEGREIEIGPQAYAAVDEKEIKVYPVLRGLSENELVVTKANFLIDSQSQIAGTAASAYGGALETEEGGGPPQPIHQH